MKLGKPICVLLTYAKRFEESGPTLTTSTVFVVRSVPDDCVDVVEAAKHRAYCLLMRRFSLGPLKPLLLESHVLGAGEARKSGFRCVDENGSSYEAGTLPHWGRECLYCGDPVEDDERICHRCGPRDPREERW